MAYRHDNDLKFLSNFESNDLNDLVYCITHDKDGGVRLMEKLTSNALYKRHYPDHRQYWELIAAEVQCFGGNTIMNFLRGEGVPYREVLIDVCEKLKVNFNNKSGVEIIEQNLLMKIVEDSIAKMSTAELRELADSLGMQNTELIKAEALIANFQAIFMLGGFKSYQITLIVVNAVMRALFGHGLVLAGNAALVRIAAIIAGPIGLAITGLLTAIDLAGPAYRVTIPAAIQIAFLRQKFQYGNLIEA